MHARKRVTRALARRISWSLASALVPSAFALCAIPILTRRLGPERFGILALAWVVVSYFGLLDLGFSRAITKLVAEKAFGPQCKDLPDLVRTAALSISTLSAGGAACLAAIVPWAAIHVLRAPTPLLQEAARSLYWLALAIPLTLVATCLSAAMEGAGRFDLIARVRIPLSAFNYCEPALLVFFTRRLDLIVAGLVLGRAAAVLSYGYCCATMRPPLITRQARFRLPAVRDLLRLGGWLTLSNVVGPVMHYLDRFIVSSMLGISRVAYYSLASDSSYRFAILPNSIASVFYPAFSEADATGKDLSPLFARGFNYAFAATFVPTLALAAFAPEALRLWVGQAFAAPTSRPLQIFALGVFLNGLAFIPYSLLQGCGRPDLTAKFHLIELPIFLATFVPLISVWGITGGAVAWVTRVLIDLVILLFASMRLVGRRRCAVAMLAAVLSIPAFVIVAAVPPLAARAWIFIVAAVGMLALEAPRVIAQNELVNWRGALGRLIQRARRQS